MLLSAYGEAESPNRAAPVLSGADCDRGGHEGNAMRFCERGLLAITLWMSILLAACSGQQSSRSEAPAPASQPAPDNGRNNGRTAEAAPDPVPPPAAMPAPAPPRPAAAAAAAAAVPPVPDDLKRMRDETRAIDLPKAPPGTDSAKLPTPAKAEAAKAAVSQSRFPWPPPRPSAAFTLPRTLLWRALSVTDAAGFAARRMGDFDTMLSAALDRAGYVERSYYQVPGGFALATQLERIDDDGQSAKGEARWILGQPQRGSFSLGDYLKALFAAAPGRFRIVVLVVSSMPFTTSDVEPGVETARAWVTGGMSALPPDIAAQPYGPNGGTQALVYEFEKPPGGSAQVKSPGHISAQNHLAGIQLLTNLAP